MPRTPTKTLPELAIDSWMFGADAAMVVWLRSLRMMAGGKLAEREAERMVSEKISANIGFFPAMMLGGFDQTAEAFGARALAHYAAPVRANRRRLSRSR